MENEPNILEHEIQSVIPRLLSQDGCSNIRGTQRYKTSTPFYALKVSLVHQNINRADGKPNTESNQPGESTSVSLEVHHSGIYSH